MLFTYQHHGNDDALDTTIDESRISSHKIHINYMYFSYAAVLVHCLCFNLFSSNSNFWASFATDSCSLVAN